MTTVERKQQERQARIEKCLSYVKVITEPAMTQSGYITYVVVNSATVTGRRYIVHLDEAGEVTRCNCDATVPCVHMDAVTLYFKRIADIFAQDEKQEEQVVETVVAEPAYVNQLVSYNIQDVADAIRVDFNLAVEKEEKKAVSFAYGCCGHLVHVEDAGELCGPCRCK